MGVAPGSPVSASNTNNAFIDANADDIGLGVYQLQNTLGSSGPFITNIQAEHNGISAFAGRTTGSGPSSLPSWTNIDRGTAGDNLLARAEALTRAFNNTPGIGHNHDGSAGNGAPVSSLTLSSFNKYFSDFQTNTFASASGLSSNVTTTFSGRTSGGGPSAVGVPTTAPYNRVELRKDPSGDEIENPVGGFLIYGRVTFSAGTWTLTYYYVNNSGVETAYSLPSQNIRLYWREVFDANTRPTFGTDLGFIGSFDATADIIDASATESGKVNITSQTFAGVKTFQDGADMANALSLGRFDLASGSTITALTNLYSYIKFTGSSTTTLQGITAATRGSRLLIYNASSGNLTVVNQSGFASSSNRIVTSTGSDTVVSQNQSIEFLYDLGLSRWVVVSTAGSVTVGFQESIGTGNGVNTSFGPLTMVPSSEDSIAVYKDGLIVNTSLWSLSGSDILFTTAPASASSIYVWYLTNGTSTPTGPTGTLQMEFRTLTSGEATAKQLTLIATPLTATRVAVDLIGNGAQFYGDDYTVSGTILSWNGLGMDFPLSTGDKLRIIYLS